LPYNFDYIEKGRRRREKFQPANYREKFFLCERPAWKLFIGQFSILIVLEALSDAIN
jgi:hypothetical protein